jgi:hypothetical protein
MKTKIICVLTLLLVSIISCKESHPCIQEYIQCMNTCLEQEKIAYQTWKDCKEDARWVLDQRRQMCEAFQDPNQYITCWMLAIQQTQIMQYKCDSILVSKVSEINRCRYECNTSYLACLETH